jgi:16S rRNA (cytosine967-C5)-methyltransferase
LPEENDNVIKEFMTSHKDASILNINETWGVETEFGRQLFPEEKEHDGFYYARLIKL